MLQSSNYGLFCKAIKFLGDQLTARNSEAAIKLAVNEVSAEDHVNDIEITAEYWHLGLNFMEVKNTVFLQKNK